jgi:hypothetical protein
MAKKEMRDGVRRGKVGEMSEHHSSTRGGAEDVDMGAGDVAVAGAKSSTAGSRKKVPGEVQMAFLLFLTAVGAGVLETIVRIIESLSTSSGGVGVGLVVRVLIYSMVVYVVTQMRRGKGWARLTLTVLLGGLGTLSLVIDPIMWLAAGNSPLDTFTQADLLFAIVAPIRVVHLAALFGALVFMFLPAANDYFRSARQPATAAVNRK